MLIREYKKSGYKSVELRAGIDGSGNTNYVLQTTRIGSNGIDIHWSEQFKTEPEAINWVEWVL